MIDDLSRGRRFTRHERFGLALWPVSCLVATVVGYIVDGWGLAAVEFLGFGVAGYLGIRYMPRVRPPSPAAVVRPALGSGREDVMRRRNEQIGSTFALLPFVLIGVVLAVFLSATPARLAAAAAAALLLAGLIAALYIQSGRSPYWNARRERRYRRLVARLEEDHRIFDAQPRDRAKELERQEAVGRTLFVLMAVPLLLSLPLYLGAVLGAPELGAAVTLVGLLAAGAALVASMTGRRRPRA